MNTTEDDSKLKNIKDEIQNTDGFLAGSGNCRWQFLLMLYCKKELEMLSRLLKTFGMKVIKAVMDVYPCDGGTAKKPNSILFQLSGEIVIGEKNEKI